MPIRSKRCRGRAVALALLAVALVAAPACSSGDGGDEDGAAADGAPPQQGEPIDVTVEEAACEPLVAESCLLPFPSDRYTRVDETAASGLRLDLPLEAMPVNVEGTPVDPAQWNLVDGWSPGGPLVALVPGVDLEQTGAPPITDIGRSLDDDSPIVLVDADTGERHPFWAELDLLAPDDEEPVLFLRPARNLLEGHRYVVGLRDLRDADGEPIEAEPAFVALRDNRPTETDAVEARREAMDATFASLADAGIDRDELVLAWDLTVASEESLTERMLHLRDDAFAELGAAAPAFTVLDVAEEPEPGILRRVNGTIEVPQYLTGDGGPGEGFAGVEQPGDLPERTSTYEAGFLCIVPEAALEEPALPSLYGHGLLGSRGEVASAAAQTGIEHDVASCAVDWIGMSQEDAGNVARILQDLSGFSTLADRLQQGFLDFLFLGRAMTHEDGLVSDPAFQGPDGEPLLEVGELVFVGNSQGGILGGGLTAVAQDWTRSVLGVPAMNYSTLLDRSVDYEPYAPIMAEAYPDRVDQVVNLALAQVLWDRGEANGYAHHITDDPLPDTPEHQVLLFEAFGDHQVANIATENEARTIGARLAAPGLAEGRHPGEDPWFGIEALAEGEPHDGSVLVVWDFGTPAWPLGNVPNEAGDDPHGEGGDVEAVRAMVAAFLRGSWEDPCGADPCQTPPID